MVNRAAVSALAVLLLASVLAAQAPAPSSAKTGRVRGRVIAGDTTAPVRRVQVTLTPADAGGDRRRFTANTDAEGRFDIAEVPSGRYAVLAAKAGYISRQYGQRDGQPGGTFVSVTAGQTVTGIDITIARASAVTGRIVDEYGDPLAQVQVQARRVQYAADGQQRLVGASVGMTDDLGHFRVFGLEPGEYIVSATMPRLATPDTIGPSDGYLPTYYPGTAEAGSAQPVTVAAATDAVVEFAVIPGRMARISGTVTMSDGSPAAGASVTVRSAVPTTVFFSIGNSTAGADGSFSISNVPPGDYSIEARPRVVPGTGAIPEFASTALNVAGDIANLRLITTRGATVTGRVTWEGTPPRLEQVPGVFNASQPRLTAVAVDPSGFVGSAGGENGVVNADGTVRLAGLAGRVRLLFTAPGWMVKSMTLDGADVMDEPVDLTGRDTVTGLRIVVTNRLTDVSGAVHDRSGQPVKNYSVVLQSTDNLPAASIARRTRTARADQDGRFRIRGMPPGSYTAAAVLVMPQPSAAGQAAFMKQLREGGRAFTVAEGESVVLDVPLAIF